MIVFFFKFANHLFFRLLILESLWTMQLAFSIRFLNERDENLNRTRMLGFFRASDMTYYPRNEICLTLCRKILFAVTEMCHDNRMGLVFRRRRNLGRLILDQ